MWSLLFIVGIFADGSIKGVAIGVIPDETERVHQDGRRSQRQA